MRRNFYNIIKKSKIRTAAETGDFYTDLFSGALAAGDWPTRTITGVPPIRFISDGSPLSAWLIAGNSRLNEPPEYVGTKTANLFNASDVILGYHINTAGIIEPKQNRMCTANSIDLTGISDVTLNFQTSLAEGVSVIFALFSSGTLISRSSNIHAGDSIDVSNGDSCLIAFYSNPNVEVNTQNTTDIMLNAGLTAKQYEPYGYKIGVICAGQTTTIYTGDPLRKAIDGVDAVDILSSTGTITRAVDADGNALETPATQIIDAPPEIQTVRGSNTLTVDTDLQPSEITITGHIKSS